MGTHYVAQAGLKFLDSRDPAPSASWVGRLQAHSTTPVFHPLISKHRHIQEFPIRVCAPQNWYLMLTVPGKFLTGLQLSSPMSTHCSYSHILFFKCKVSHMSLFIFTHAYPQKLCPCPRYDSLVSKQNRFLPSRDNDPYLSSAFFCPLFT